MATAVEVATEEQLRQLTEEFRQNIIAIRPDITQRELEDLIAAALRDAVHQ